MILFRHALAARSIQAALALLGLSAATTLVSVSSAIRLEPPPVPVVETPAATVAWRDEDRTPMALIEEAVALAPFTPTREPSAPSATRVTPPSFETAQLQIIGTVVDGEGDSFALVSTAGAQPKVIRTGETIAGYRLRSIRQGRVVFTRIADGVRLELRVPRSQE